jgi:hypothetical protein
MGAMPAPAPEELIFRDMTFEILESQYGIREGRRRVLFERSIPEVAPSSALVDFLGRARHAMTVNERSRAYRLVAPILSELEELRLGKIMTFPEPMLEAKGVEGLRGNPDFVISGSLTPRLVPIAAIVEAKKDDTEPGLPQRIAELYASYLINGNRPSPIPAARRRGTRGSLRSSTARGRSSTSTLRSISSRSPPGCSGSSATSRTRRWPRSPSWPPSLDGALPVFHCSPRLGGAAFARAPLRR